MIINLISSNRNFSLINRKNNPQKTKFFLYIRKIGFKRKINLVSFLHAHIRTDRQTNDTASFMKDQKHFEGSFFGIPSRRLILSRFGEEHSKLCSNVTSNIRLVDGKFQNPTKNHKILLGTRCVYFNKNESDKLIECKNNESALIS